VAICVRGNDGRLQCLGEEACKTRVLHSKTLEHGDKARQAQGQPVVRARCLAPKRHLRRNPKHLEGLRQLLPPLLQHRMAHFRTNLLPCFKIFCSRSCSCGTCWVSVWRKSALIIKAVCTAGEHR